MKKSSILNMITERNADTQLLGLFGDIKFILSVLYSNKITLNYCLLQFVKNNIHTSMYISSKDLISKYIASQTSPVFVYV